MSELPSRADSHGTTSHSIFAPIVARTEPVDRRVAPEAYDCIRLCFIRTGTAFLFSEFGTKIARPGDVAMLAANTLCGCEPEGWMSMTTLFLDSDFIMDQVFWQYAFMLPDRLAAQDFASKRYAEPTQLLRLGEERGGHLIPRLDELVTLSIDGPRPERFYRIQSLFFSIIDVIAPFIAVTDSRTSPTQRPTCRPSVPRHRTYAPLRTEARRAGELLRDAFAARWTVDELSHQVHLSPSHLSRVFVEAFGKSPMAYLTMLRAQELAKLLRTTDLTVAAASSRVGWADPDYAGRQFRRSLGVTPRQYRQMSRSSARV